MEVFAIAGPLLFFAWCVFLITINTSKKIKNKNIKKRISQTERYSSLNMLRNRLGHAMDQRVSYKKRSSKEITYIQAGLSFKYVDHVLISLTAGVILTLFFGGMLNNMYITPVAFVIGYNIPFQIVVLIRNKRVNMLEKQVGVFLKMILKRYKVIDEFGKAFRYVAEEMKNEYPLNTDLAAGVTLLDLGSPMEDVLEHLEQRTANKYLGRLAEYYRIVSDIGTAEARDNLLQQAEIQFEENRQVSRRTKEKIAGPVRESYIILAMVPGIVLYQILTNRSYISFMTGTQMGKLGTASIVFVCFGCLWFINNKLGAPIE